MKAIIIISIIVILISDGLYFAPKGNDYIKWEKDMIKSGQLQ